MSSGVKSGRTNKLYYNDKPDTASGGLGTYDTPVWVLIDRIGDLDRANAKSSTEVDMRASETTIVVYGNKTRELSYTYYKREGIADSVYNVLLQSFENDEFLDIAIAEADIGTPGTVYDRGPFIVADMSKAEPVAGVDTFDITKNIADAVQDDGITPFIYLSNVVAT